jgi:hypothetical protein
MKMNRYLLSALLCGLSMVLAACGAVSPQLGPTAIPTASPVLPTPSPAPVSLATLTPLSGTPLSAVTPSADMCTAENLPKTVNLVNTYMIQFGNYESLAQAVVQSQLPLVIKAMQGIRNAAASQAIPPCLADLKTYALKHMDTVLQTLDAFRSNPNKQALPTAIKQAQNDYGQYTTELARLMGPVAGAPGTQPAKTQPSTMVLNPGPNPLNLHVSPSLTSQTIGVLNASETAMVLGKSSNGEWVQIEVPGQNGQKAWVYASLVEYLSGNPNALPVATP